MAILAQWLEHSAWIAKLGFEFPSHPPSQTPRSRHFLSQKLWHFHKNIRPCVENECYCPRTVNISNVNFTLINKCSLTQCGLVRPCDVIELGEHWLTDGTKPLTEPISTNQRWGLVTFTLGQFTDVSIWYDFKITNFTLQPHLPRTSELSVAMVYWIANFKKQQFDWWIHQYNIYWPVNLSFKCAYNV